MARKCLMSLALWNAKTGEAIFAAAPTADADSAAGEKGGKGKRIVMQKSNDHYMQC